jgi:hypothetical protein
MNPDSDMYSGCQMSGASCWQVAWQMKMAVCDKQLIADDVKCCVLFCPFHDYVGKYLAREVAVTVINFH